MDYYDAWLIYHARLVTFGEGHHSVLKARKDCENIARRFPS